ncbi:MAG: hypothetical protein CL760_09080 [Chloroflexi bacterium]|nr:hypothetical protein [Chloroflexota bacterium]|tara:strand:- start:36032 stop:36232 length:201 start_codon:yes stop_codon:yes gene_type:complete
MKKLIEIISVIITKESEKEIYNSIKSIKPDLSENEVSEIIAAAKLYNTRRMTKTFLTHKLKKYGFE